MALLLVVAFTFLIVLSAAPQNTAYAQTSNYSITRVDHQVQVMYSGNIVVLDTIHLSAPAQYSFMIGLPLQYSDNVLKALAYDDNHVYDVNLGVPLGDRGGFYGAKLNFGRYTPNSFTVAFVLNNGLVEDNGGGNYTLLYPAYPSLTQEAEACSVTLTFPDIVSSISISKSDGDVTDVSYEVANLPAYTFTAATAEVELSSGAIQPATVSNLKRDLTIDSTGAVASTDTYRLTSNASSISSFVLNVPSEASNVLVRDQFGTPLNVYLANYNNVMLVNITLSSFVETNQPTTLTVEYGLPGATLQGGKYVLVDFQLFPKFQYVVEHATMTFNPPEGASIITPQVNSLAQTSTLTRDTFQDTLTVAEESISYVDYLAPQANTIQLSYSYNPAWVSFRATFWAALAAALACVGAVVYRKVRPAEETYKTRVQKLTERRRTLNPEHDNRLTEIKTGQPITADVINDFLNAYEDKKALRAELGALKAKAQKGKIPRRQYKVQKQAIETRLESVNRHLGRVKAVFRGSAGSYPGLAKQLDLAEEDLAAAEQNIGSLEWRQSRGEITLEAYKKTVVDYQKMRDKAESAINGILVRLREKTR